MLLLLLFSIEKACCWGDNGVKKNKKILNARVFFQCFNGDDAREQKSKMFCFEFFSPFRSLYWFDDETVNDIRMIGWCCLDENLSLQTRFSLFHTRKIFDVQTIKIFEHTNGCICIKNIYWCTQKIPSLIKNS